MVCENLFCIYQSDDKCTLKEIQLDTAGICTSCIYPAFNEAYLRQEKLKLLKKYNENE